MWGEGGGVVHSSSGLTSIGIVPPIEFLKEICEALDRILALMVELSLRRIKSRNNRYYCWCLYT